MPCEAKLQRMRAHLFGDFFLRCFLFPKLGGCLPKLRKTNAVVQPENENS
jgi:hypothetical protein